MASDIWQPKIDRYVDAELSEEEMRAMDAHLRECSSCAAQALRQMQLKRATKLAARRYAPSPQFRRKIADQVIADQVIADQVKGARRPVPWRWGWAPLLAAAVMSPPGCGNISKSFVGAGAVRTVALRVNRYPCCKPCRLQPGGRSVLRPAYRQALVPGQSAVHV